MSPPPHHYKPRCAHTNAKIELLSLNYRNKRVFKVYMPKLVGEVEPKALEHFKVEAVKKIEKWLKELIISAPPLLSLLHCFILRFVRPLVLR